MGRGSDIGGPIGGPLDYDARAVMFSPVTDKYNTDRPTDRPKSGLCGRVDPETIKNAREFSVCIQRMKTVAKR